ncbi:MAG: hypothetical protein A2Z03_01170 [Chloroflexi bacterium RBG_16_56_8]|nr:MAG: hypothetical protein A2Z03_01170 [Chloroflexi bacterium RBG_16_56_8]
MSRASAARPQSYLPPLENGDQLTRAEFERRYEAMLDVNKAELIEGAVHMPTPVSVSHAKPHAHIMSWLGTYCAATPGVEVYDNATVLLDADNEVQPDALLQLEPKAGGHSRVSAAGYLEGAPELIVEIAATSAAIDLHAKMNVYRRTQVQEYLVWQTFEKRLDWFELRDERYAALAPDENGLLRSRVFPGLRLAVEALLEGNLGAVLGELQKGLSSKEHAKFAKHLAESVAH